MLAAFEGICKHALVLDEEAVKSRLIARLLSRGESAPDKNQASRCRVRESQFSELISEKCVSCVIEPIHHIMDKVEVNKRQKNYTNMQTDKIQTSFVKKVKKKNTFLEIPETGPPGLAP